MRDTRAPQAQRAPPHPTLPGGQDVQDELVTPAGGHICRARSLHPKGGQGPRHPTQKGTALQVPGPWPPHPEAACVPSPRGKQPPADCSRPVPTWLHLAPE